MSAIDHGIVTKTVKLSPGAHERAKELSKKLGARISDVYSACLLHMPEAELQRVLEEHQAQQDSMPKIIRGLMNRAHLLTPEEKAMLRDVLT